MILFFINALRMEFKIGSPPGTVLKCCRTLFFEAYSLKRTMFNDIISELKKEIARGMSNESLITLSSRSQLSGKYIKELVKMAKAKGHDPTREHVQSMSIPNTAQSGTSDIANSILSD